MARLYRKIITIRATDSPNVKLALREIAVGKEPSGRTLIPGVLTWDDYQRRLRTWDPIRQCIGLEARFWVGKDVLMFPPDWIDESHRWARERTHYPTEKWLGCDPAEGQDSSCWSIVDRIGLLDCIEMKTPDTTVITTVTKDLMRKHNIPPEHVAFDPGGGGKEHVDRLRKEGFNVRAIAFGSSPSLSLRRGLQRLEAKRDIQEERSAYFNRRSEMYAELRELIDPSLGGHFGIPERFVELRMELAPIPLTYDDKQRLKLLPKNKSGEDKNGTLIGLIGHSPDRADSLCLAIHCMLHKEMRTVAGPA